jgi:hypothetical protein
MNKAWRKGVGGGKSGIFNDGLTGPHVTEVTYFKREQLSPTVLLGGAWGGSKMGG